MQKSGQKNNRKRIVKGGFAVPETLEICGRTYRVTVDNKKYGGEFYTVNQTITLGIKSLTRDYIKSMLLHEILEIIFVERDLRFNRPKTNPDNEDYLFHFNHRDFVNVIADLHGVLKQLKGIL